MTLPYKLESRDGIPDGMEDHYKETEDGFQLDLDADVKTQDDVDNLETALGKERKLRRDAEKKAKKLPEDFSSEEWERLKELQDKKDDGESNKKDDAELQRLKDKYEARLEEKEQEAEKYKDSLYQRLQEQDLEKHLREAGVMNSLMRGAKASLMPEVKVIEEDGELKAVAGVAEKDLGTFVSEWAKTDEGKAYIKAKDTSGGGTRKGTKSGDFSSVKSKADLKNSKEKSNFIKDNGYDAFMALPAK